MIANGIAAGYSLIQAIRCVVSAVKGSVLFSKPLAWVIFSFDQVHIYIYISNEAFTCKSGFEASVNGVVF